MDYWSLVSTVALSYSPPGERLIGLSAVWCLSSSVCYSVVPPKSPRGVAVATGSITGD